MIKWLLDKLNPKLSQDIIKVNPAIEGVVTLSLIDNRRVVHEVVGNNIWTLTGREYLAELIALKLYAPVEGNRQYFRNDRVAYIGMGIQKLRLSKSLLNCGVSKTKAYR